MIGPDHHPAPGARPGETISVGPEHRWVAYESLGTMCAAAYLQGHLLRRDLAGWWITDVIGGRVPVDDLTVARLVGTVPDGWPVLEEQAPLLGVELLLGVA